MAKTFMIVDGSSLLHRAFYALPLLRTSSGKYTNAVYGFINMLLRLLEQERPDYLAIAFDKARKTFRNELYTEYKAQRSATPSELSQQFELVREVLGAFGVSILEQDGFEGDDIIGTLTRKAKADGYRTLIVTGDKDALQLIAEQTTVLLTKKGITEMEAVDGQALQNKYGLLPAQIIDLKGLMGDSSDNIPGVPGVGEKTALKLLQQFETMDNLYRHLEQVSGKKLQEKLRIHEQDAFLSRKLATICQEVPLSMQITDCEVHPNGQKLQELFAELEFRNLYGRVADKFGLEKAATVSAQDLALPVTRPAEREALERLQARTDSALILAPQLAIQSNGQVHLTGAAWMDAEEGVFLPADAPGWEQVLAALACPHRVKVLPDCKNVYRAAISQNFTLAGPLLDVGLVAYLLDPTVSDYTLPALSARYLGVPVPWSEKKQGQEEAYLCWSAQTLSALTPILKEKLQQEDQEGLYADLELPLAAVLAAMEDCGIRVDTVRLQELSAEIGGSIEQALAKVYQQAGETFNVNSTKQLGSILFEKLGLPALKKTKTGFSTDAEVLEKLREEHPIVTTILEYRLLAKLKSTYLDGLQHLVERGEDRIHTSFNQTVTATGRLSSSEPNLQNLPIRTEEGRKIRELFIPGIGYDKILTADYSQIELRILAHLSADENMQEGFRENQDIHARTASEVFGVPLAEVTPIMRMRAKAVNFGIIYGISDYGLSRDIGVPRKEAGMYIQSYLERYPKVQAFMQDMVAQAREKGYATTLLGRRRNLPGIDSKNFNIRSFAERTAMNTPIQGTAADIIKKAMVTVAQELKAKKLNSRLLLQVHDELVLEITRQEEQEVAQLVKQAMEGAVSLAVPLIVEVKTGANWARAK